MGEWGRRSVKGIAGRARAVNATVDSIIRARADAEQAVDGGVDDLKRSLALEQLAAMPLESLRPLVSGRIAWGTLVGGGYATVADALMAGPEGLLAVHGVGEHSAFEVWRASEDVFSQTIDQVRLTVDPNSADPRVRVLVDALVRLDAVNQATRVMWPAAQELGVAVESPLARVGVAQSPLKWLLAGSKRRELARRGAEELEAVLAGDQVAVLEQPGLLGRVREASGVTDPVERFVAEPARYLSLLDFRSGGVQGASGDLDAELLARIDGIELDVSLLAVMLRRYQSFGARFALAQRRVILGDDMGLGKTIQALAVMSHLAAQARSLGTVARFLVVAPASVLVNWEREIAGKSDLDVFGLHGTREAGNLQAWLGSGGVAVTTYEYTAQLDLEHELDLLVVDEAHYVKNPDAQRSQRVGVLAARSSRVLMMTGTPIENRAGEFIDLIAMLDPVLAASLMESVLVVNPVAFRRLVAPAYLRRNVEDVLAELPDRIEIDEWEEMTDHDLQHYRHALAEGNFMAVRRAGFAAAGMGRSAKMNRLREIVAEARASGHKVIVYSYFLEVLAAVCKELPDVVLGPITGAMRPQARQDLVDEFTAAPSGAVLVAQVVAGGVGLNIQAASIVILCEPQLKPSTEDQAIARAHRMGQLKNVQVHRLLNPDTIDERIEEILAGKRDVFTDYARDSDLAATAEGAVDGRMALRLVQGERDRLGITE